MTKALTKAEQAELDAARNAVLLSTGEIQGQYQTIDVVFVMGGSQSGLFRTADPQEAFHRAREALQVAALQLGGNAVAFCSFGYHPYSTAGACGGGANFAVTAWGTVVRVMQ